MKMGYAQVALLAIFHGAAFNVGVHGKDSCGYEGESPCADGCNTDQFPKDVGDVAPTYYPGRDIFVEAPQGYRQKAGLCTRCGHLYEPVCKSPNGKPLCWIDAHAGRYMEATEDGFCVPPKHSVGCGTTGEPPCPGDEVDKYGTVAIVQRSSDDTGWDISADIGINSDGCMLSEHNLLLRFMKAPKEWLPDGHKCANVCIPCGIDGAPLCPFSNSCVRRNSEDPKHPSKYRDGPVISNEGVCKALRCGAATELEDLPPCGDGDPSLGALDGNGDGCAEPYVLKDGVCKEAPEPATQPSPLELQEYRCSTPGEMLVDDGVIQEAVMLSQTKSNISAEHLANIKESKGKCGSCGRDREMRCLAMDFNGCLVNEGYIFDEQTGVCQAAACGGGPFYNSPPWDSPLCPAQPPKFSKSKNPINVNTNCQYFHNRIKEDPNAGNSPRDTCEPCGWPGSMCESECIYAIEYVRSANAPDYQRSGQFAVRPEFRTGGALTGHCKDLPVMDMYPDKCPQPKRVGDGNLDDSAPALVVDGTDEDPSFGTASNPDSCQKSSDLVSQVYDSKCPGGGSPVRKHGQCGGVDYSGSTCCFGYSVCVKKSPFMSVCEEANVPTSVVPWHHTCTVDNDNCEIGSKCEEAGGSAYCRVDSEMISSASSTRGASKGAAVGISFGALTLLLLAVAIGFLIGRKRTLSRGQFKVGEWNGGDTLSVKGGLREENKALAPPGHTYLDMAAASEAEAMHHSHLRNADDTMGSPEHVLPTSDFGIGKRA